MGSRFFRFCDDTRGGCGQRFKPCGKTSRFCNKCLKKKLQQRQITIGKNFKYMKKHGTYFSLRRYLEKHSQTKQVGATITV